MNKLTINGEIDVAIVGGGPIGIETAIAFKQQGVRSILFEAAQIGEAISRWPPNTHFFSTPEHVALAGVPVQTLDQRPISGEEYLAYMRMLVEYFDIDLHNYEPVTGVDRDEGGFIVHTHKRGEERRYRARYVVFCTGGMAGPRKLGIPGEDLPHVTHYFPGPHAYFRTRLLVVGGKNSALESALRCWRAGSQVALSYRHSDFQWDVVKPHLAGDLKTRLEKDEIHFYPSTIPVEITNDAVFLAPTEDGVTPNGRITRHETDFVLLATGFQADQSLLRAAGIELTGADEVPVFNPNTMETNVPGIFVAGTAAGGTQAKFKLFISTTHAHVGKIVYAVTGHAPEKLGSVPARDSAVSWEEVKAN
ncbi:SidA/IucD/PvdA family monooxygenase [bacterium]|nr:SidA/IucD/PvdA family monooxygenase [bacterium]